MLLTCRTHPVVVLAATAFVGLTHIPYCHAQEIAGRVAFEAASIKTVTGDSFETKLSRSGGRITWTIDLGNLISYAYHLPPTRISGIPNASIFRVDAITAATSSEDEIRQMFQSLLVERFKMASHRVTRQGEGYVLSIGKEGAKMKEAEASALPNGAISAIIPENGIVAIKGDGVTILQLVDTLQRTLSKVVWDHTGLNGNYNFSFRYSSNVDIITDAPTLVTALQKDLGLRLEKKKGPVETLIVDHIERAPSEN